MAMCTIQRFSAAPGQRSNLDPCCNHPVADCGVNRCERQ